MSAEISSIKHIPDEPPIEELKKLIELWKNGQYLTGEFIGTLLYVMAWAAQKLLPTVDKDDPIVYGSDPKLAEAISLACELYETVSGTAPPVSGPITGNIFNLLLTVIVNRLIDMAADPEVREKIRQAILDWIDQVF